jgi:hypothetical protein
MTPQERQLVAELFDRLATLENAPRDADAEQAIREGLRQAPHAVYALVQTVLVQDEALKRAEAHLRELEAGLGEGPAQRPAGFLDGMRDALLGRRDAPHAGSVPTVRPGVAGGGLPPGYGAVPGAAGGSFLGTAAAAAAGVIGGSLLLDGIRSMMGHRQGAFAGFDPSTASAGSAGQYASPWDHTAQGDLARQAGLDDIGRGTGGRDTGRGLFDTSGDAEEIQDAGPFDEDFGGDGGFDGGSDSA